jgi:hypothetical protein
MKSMLTLLAGLAVLSLSSGVQADCGGCGSKTTAAQVTTAAGCCASKSCSEGTCSESTATASTCTAGQCTAGQCTAGQCAAGQCTAGQCTEGKSTEGQCSAGACAASKCSETTCATATCASEKACASDKGCPIAAAMERLPKMTFAVGEKQVCCPKEAAKLASESNGHIHFCVSNKEFDSQAEAQAALLEATEKFVAKVAEPHTCPQSGQTTLAGQPQSCSKMAAHTAKLMKQAMEKVQMTYMVGEKACHCPVEAGKLAQESGQEKVFVVGEEKTGCEKTARLNLVRAKYKAAIEAMVQAQAQNAGSQSAGS